VSGTIIDELLIRWEEQRRDGATPSVQELCAGHPDLADELARRIAAFESMEALLGVGAAKTLPENGPRQAVPPHLGEKLRGLGYELIEVIDQGGMGVVYKALQIELRRTVALKMIAGFRVGPKQLARFRVEAEAVARLHHPHIVQIYEIGEVDGHSFFSMEFVEGGTLARRLAGEPLPEALAVTWIEQLARAVHHAHTRGIVHRDLKPANILLAKDEGGNSKDEKQADTAGSSSPCNLPPSSAPGSVVPKIADFGLAKRLEVESDHTTTGEVLGTPAYMAPEQAQGRTSAIGPVSDVYALGTILYEALTGRPPFKADTVLETLQQVIADEPTPPRRWNAKLPRDLEAICLKCLEKNPADRYASAEALANDLERFRADRPVLARRVSAVRRAARWAHRRRVLIAAVLLIFVLAGCAAAAARWNATRERLDGQFVGLIIDERERRIARAVVVAPRAREILQRNCFACHGSNPAKVDRKFYVLDRTSLLDPDRKNVVPEHPDVSRLVQRIEDGSMPPEEKETEFPRVSELELGLLKEWIAGGAPAFPPEDPLDPTPPVVPYSELAAEVKSIFRKHCYDCHLFTKPESGIKIMNHDLLVMKRKVVIPGSPKTSELYQLLLLPPDSEHVMPPSDRERLEPEEIEKVREWIEKGAPPFPRTREKK
jgi:serine/threonine protein kinase/mono/diheme cytochrome c family protein